MLAWEEKEVEGQVPRDMEALRASLLRKEEALRKSEQEASILRSELELLKSSDTSKKTEVGCMTSYSQVPCL